MKKIYLIIILIISIISIGFVSADFEKGNKLYNITEKYATGANLEGWINISLKNELSNSLLEAFGKSVKLIDFLENNNAEYECNPQDCNVNYDSSNPQKTKTITLNNEDKYVGLKLKGNIEYIDSISFKIESNAESSCSNQLKIDFFDDNITDFGNAKASVNLCSGSKSYGCFDLTDQNEENVISETPYCQKIKIPESPGIKAGAWIKKLNGNRNITMVIYDGDNEIENANCKISGVSSNGEEVYCDINYSFLESKEYYVCLYSNEGEGEYVIRQNTNNEDVCGFNNYPIEDEEAAYQIFVIPKKFDILTNVNVTNTFRNEESLSIEAENYLRERYDGLDCSEECVIPIKIVSNSLQTVILKDLEMKYKKTSGSVIERNFYDISKSGALINSNFQQLYLEKSNLTIPDSTGNKELKLTLNGKEIFSKRIGISKAAKINSVSPTMTGAAYPTTFTANIGIEKNVEVTDYIWDFGDGIKKTTKTNSVIHSYNNTGNYSLKLTIKLKDYEFSKNFKIQVGSPKILLNSSLTKKLSDMSKLKTKINTFSQLEKNKINNLINASEIEETLKQIEKNYLKSYSESDYIKLMNELNLVQVPSSVTKSATMNSIPFYVEKDNIDISIAELIENKDYKGESNDFKDAVLEWNMENLESTISLDKIKLEFSPNEEVEIKFFDINIKKKKSLNYDVYFVLNNIENLEFGEGSSVEDESGNKIIKLSDETNRILFSTTDEEVNFENLPAFIFPSLEKLPTYIEKTICNNNKKCEKDEGETTSNCADCKSYLKWYLAGLIIMISIVVYILLHIWYIKKYETYLFGKRNNVFNIVTYINNSKRQKIDKHTIASNLSKAGWSSEQINYGFKRAKGIIIGMPGLTSMIKLLHRSNTKQNMIYRKV